MRGEGPYSRSCEPALLDNPRPLCASPRRSRRASRTGRDARECTPTGPIHAVRCAPTDVGTSTRLSGWVHRVRDHGGLLFIDLRDHYGITQVVADPDSPAFKTAESVRAEWVIRVDGEVRNRPAGHAEHRTCRPARSRCSSREIEVLSEAAELPLPVFGEPDYPEDIRLQLSLPRSSARATASQHREAARRSSRRSAGG